MMPASCACVERLGDGHADGGRARRRHAARVAITCARLVPVEQLHDEEQMAVVGLAEVGDANAVIVIEPRRRARLAMEARDRLGVGGQLGRKIFTATGLSISVWVAR